MVGLRVNTDFIGRSNDLSNHNPIIINNNRHKDTVPRPDWRTSLIIIIHHHHHMNEQNQQANRNNPNKYYYTN